MRGAGSLLATVLINDREAGTTLKIVQRDVRADEAVLVVVGRLVIPRLPTTYTFVSKIDSGSKN